LTPPNAELMQHNPLNKVPTLVLDDGTALYDSIVICEYLDSVGPGPKLFPANERRSSLGRVTSPRARQRLRRSTHRMAYGNDIAAGTAVAGKTG
jgi:glutathione S-transferase